MPETNDHITLALRYLNPYRNSDRGSLRLRVIAFSPSQISHSKHCNFTRLLTKIDIHIHTYTLDVATDVATEEKRSIRLTVYNWSLICDDVGDGDRLPSSRDAMTTAGKTFTVHTQNKDSRDDMLTSTSLTALFESVISSLLD